MMKDIPRVIKNDVKKLYKGRVTILYGPRRVGKTTLVKEIFSEFTGKKKYETGDNELVKRKLGSGYLHEIRDFTKELDLLIIDEAQKIPNIGNALKLLIDDNPDINIIVTGSASFELAGQVGEPLTGRKFEYFLYPLAYQELRFRYVNDFEASQDLPKRLIYGSYPDILLENDSNLRRLKLKELVNSLLLKDILELERVKSSKLLMDLLQSLAFQIGSEVSQTELATKLQIDQKTVGRYLDLLEKSFIIFNLRGYSRNLRKEITKKSKYYFFDNGVRNALISNFNDLNIRNDVDTLWENYIIVERLKHQEYSNILSNNFFWRTWDKQEVDWLEEREGSLFAYEFTYNPRKKAKIPSQLKANYPEAHFEVITPENYVELIA